ncbi:MAG: septum formation initiator family protein [Parasporobacterium sp.]|nr:septum formation initiator family protein [Parasporobacterium sp.]
MNTSLEKKLRKNRIKAVAVAMAVILLCFILLTQILDVNRRNQELQARKARLDEQYAEQEIRSQELEDEALYIGTEEYIEEKAKSIGYVYPDETVFIRED